MFTEKEDYNTARARSNGSSMMVLNGDKKVITKIYCLKVVLGAFLISFTKSPKGNHTHAQTNSSALSIVQ